MDEINHVNRRVVLAAALGLAASAALPSIRAAKAAESAWRLLPGEGPAARWDHTLTADNESKQLLLFGGRDANGAAFADTWIYDLTERSWKQVDSAGPQPRFGQAVATDQAGRRMLLFGGQSADTFYNDTWSFDVATESWTLLHDGGGPAPSPRYGLAAVLDDAGRFIVSHGFTFEGRFDDTWAFDPESSTWTELSPAPGAARPLKRCLHEMAWDASSNTMLLYGGCSSGFGPCPQGDLWRFDPATGSWTELTPASGPSARSNPALFFDDRADRALLVGGLSEAGYVNDTWDGRAAGDGFAWSPLVATGDGPSPRASHDIVLTRGDLYLFGGSGTAGITADLWKLSLE
ncbi:MAG: hypothetical protein IT336_06750 [Thermomicrobiales bacterium]|nr:hypothetical protein [Thermomicrobiales bacterium]